MQEIFLLQSATRGEGRAEPGKKAITEQKEANTHIQHTHTHTCDFYGRFWKSFFMLVCIYSDFYADLSLFNRRNNTPTHSREVGRVAQRRETQCGREITKRITQIDKFAGATFSRWTTVVREKLCICATKVLTKTKSQAKDGMKRKQKQKQNKNKNNRRWKAQWEMWQLQRNLT